MEKLHLNYFIKRFNALEAEVQSGAIKTDEGLEELKKSVKEIRKMVSDYEDNLGSAIDELEDRVIAFDKALVEQKTLYETIIYRLDHMNQRISELETMDTKTRDKRNDLYEKIFMAIIGGLITYLFSKI